MKKKPQEKHFLGIELYLNTKTGNILVNDCKGKRVIKNSIFTEPKKGKSKTTKE